LRLPRHSRLSLRYRLPLTYAAVALLAVLLVGGISFLILSTYYSGAERDYLKAGATRATRDLGSVDWTAVSSGDATSVSLATQKAAGAALAIQVRVQVISSSGTTLADSGSPGQIDPSAAGAQAQTGGTGGTGAAAGGGKGEPGGGSGDGLPSPIGPGLFGGDGSGSATRSSEVYEQPLTVNGTTVGTLRLSEAPAYGTAILRDTFVGWGLAAIAAVLLAGGLGLIWSRRLTRPLLRVTAASDRMAAGDLSVQVDVRRADEIGRLAHSFNSMAARTEHTVVALRQFVADAAHELGTPLTALEADLELAYERSESQEGRRLMKRAMHQAERLDRLSESLLQLSRLDAGEFSGGPLRLDLVEFMQSMADGAASRAEQAEIELRLHLPDEPVWVAGYADKLQTAVENLLDNALKFTDPGGRVILGLITDPGGTATLRVSDTGIGIPPEDLKELFGRFHRGRNANPYPGNGLGLAIVKATMDIHGGAVSVESGPGGSTFALSLPTV